MKTVTVTTQAELDQALADKADEIIIWSPPGVWLEISDSGSASVWAYGSASVWAYDSASVQAYDSASVRAAGSASVRAYDSASVQAYSSASVQAYDSASVWAYGSASVQAYDSASVQAYGSASVRASGSASVQAYDSASVQAYDSASVQAYDSASVRAYGSASVRAGRHVAVHLYSQRVTIEGGVVIDLTAIDETNPEQWCDLHGVAVTDGTATLYKALDGALTSGHAYRKTTWPVGKTVTAEDWRDTNDCGGGLHLGPTTGHATVYNETATRWVRVEVPVTELRPIPGDPAKCKVRSCRVVAEVDAMGREVSR